MATRQSDTVTTFWKVRSLVLSFVRILSFVWVCRSCGCCLSKRSCWIASSLVCGAVRECQSRRVVISRMSEGVFMYHVEIKKCHVQGDEGSVVLKEVRKTMSKEGGKRQAELNGHKNEWVRCSELKFMIRRVKRVKFVQSTWNASTGHCYSTSQVYTRCYNWWVTSQESQSRNHLTKGDHSHKAQPSSRMDKDPWENWISLCMI